MSTTATFDALDRLRTGAPLAQPDAFAVLQYVGILERAARTLDALLDALLDTMTTNTIDAPLIAEVLKGMPTRYHDDRHAARHGFRLAEFILFECDGSMHEARVALALWNERAGSPLTRPRLDALCAQARLFGGPPSMREAA